MKKPQRSLIGQILVSGGFLSTRDLETALEEQRRTNLMLGQVLVGMGVLDPVDLQAALAIQRHLDEPEQAARFAAGAREMLGDLLVRAGRLSTGQLDRALAMQKRDGGRLGEVLISMGLLNEQQLDFMLEFQRGQDQGNSSPGPLRLGEIMLSAGYISRGQLDEALRRQPGSGKKLGEVLVEEGYAKLDHVEHGVRLQKMLIGAVMSVMLVACGGGGGGDSAAEVATPGSDKLISTTSQDQARQSDNNYFFVISDDYGLLNPTFYYSTDNDKFWSIQADIAEDVYDRDYRCVIRIHIPKEDGVMPEINKKFSIEDNPLYEKFPGVFLILNGQESTNKKVEAGTISFEPASDPGDEVNGSFDVLLTDYDSGLSPAPKYRITGTFNFKMGTYSSV